jgi:hypothetical protein
MKREFGKALIEEVLARKDLAKVASTSGAFIPGHGTPTVLLFARNRAPRGDAVRVIMGKRGEPGKPADPGKGKVWSSILELHEQSGKESEFVSIADVPRVTMSAHPWSIGGGGAAALKERIDESATCRMAQVAASVGITSVTGEDEAYPQPTPRVFQRLGVGPTRPLVLGDGVRDWAINECMDAAWPYDDALELVTIDKLDGIRRFLWWYRAILGRRKRFGTPMLERGLTWYEWQELYADKLRTPLTIAFAFKATHNHFVLDRGGKVFKQTAPVIKLPADATEAQHLVLLAQLNSSTGEFWVKQTCHNCGYSAASGGGRMTAEPFDDFYERDGTKLESFPLIAAYHAQLESFARELDSLARVRVADSPRVTLDAHPVSGASALLRALDARRERDLSRLSQMVGLQEELDWLCYRLYRLDPEGADVRDPEHVPPLQPGLRPFEITLAQEDAERRAAVARGEEPDEQPTAWFERHGWEPHVTTDDPISLARIERTAASRDLSLVEQPTYKRRWYRPDYEKEERQAMELWLSDRIEAWAKERKEPFTLRQAAGALRSDAAVLAVAEIYTGKADFDLDALVGERIRIESVPGNKHHVFKPDGLIKRAQWEKTWDLQHLEDAGKLPLGEDGKPAPIPVPPKYERGDYLKGESWSLRGKLDVPKERFIAFTEAPAEVSDEPLYGWAGWTHRERAKVLLGLDEKAESAGVKVPDRYGLLYGVWFLLPYVAWESAAAASDFRADVKSLVGEQGVTEEMLADWASRFPATRPRAARARRGAR